MAGPAPTRENDRDLAHAGWRRIRWSGLQVYLNSGGAGLRPAKSSAEATTLGDVDLHQLSVMHSQLDHAEPKPVERFDNDTKVFRQVGMVDGGLKAFDRTHKASPAVPRRMCRAALILSTKTVDNHKAANGAKFSAEGPKAILPRHHRTAAQVRCGRTAAPNRGFPRCGREPAASAPASDIPPRRDNACTSRARSGSRTARAPASRA